jgi:hypothetical protein
VNNAKTTVIPLTLPSLQAMALAQFVKRVDFETITRFAAVTVVCDDGKSEADLIWLALIALRGALAEQVPDLPIATGASRTSLGRQRTNGGRAFTWWRENHSARRGRLCVRRG